MKYKQNNPRFEVEGISNFLKQENSKRARLPLQQSRQTSVDRSQPATPNKTVPFASKIKWYLVLAGAKGFIPRRFCTFLINVFGLKHK